MTLMEIVLLGKQQRSMERKARRILNAKLKAGESMGVTDLIAEVQRRTPAAAAVDVADAVWTVVKRIDPTARRPAA